MRRLALLFALIAMVSAAIRVVTPERIAAAAIRVSSAPDRFREGIFRAVRMLTKRLRPLLPMAN